MTKEAFDWKKFQKRMNYSDKELEIFMSDPRRANAAPKLYSRDLMKKFLIFEVVESHGCTVGLKVGDRLFFRGFGAMDLRRSSPIWCAHALAGIATIANMAEDRYVAGLEPNDMVYNHIPCLDVGSKRGWGQVIVKAYVKDEDELSN